MIHFRKICKCTLKILLFPDFFQRLKFSLTRSEILNFFCSSPITSLWPNLWRLLKVHDSLRRFFYSHSQSIPVHAYVVKNELIRSLKPQNYEELSSKSKTLQSHLKTKLGIDFLREQLAVCVTNEPCNRCQTERLAKAKLNTQKLAFYLQTDLQCLKFNISLMPCKFTQFFIGYYNKSFHV